MSSEWPSATMVCCVCARVCVCAPLIAKVDPEKQHLGLSEIVYAKIYWFIIVVHSCDGQI